MITEVKKMIRKAKTVYGYVLTSDNQGRYLALVKKDVLAMLNNEYAIQDIEMHKFKMGKDKQGNINLYIN